ncbi:MAG TPA: peptidoglycan-associated lipoprotein Pal [Candidatus Tectomicrobia bacterium]
MTMRPFLSSVTLVALTLTFFLVGCSKEEPPPPTAEAQPRPAAPPPPPPAAPAPPSGPSISQQAFQDFQNQDIFFDYDQYDLRTDARATLDRKASFLNQNSSVRSQIEGHCDERGTNEYNLALGERRANAAKQYLTTAGISGGRLSTISYGEERPLDPGRNEAAWARNRRAHFVITGQ